MTKPTEWEIVDDSAAADSMPRAHLMQMLLGRAWRWKLAGLVVIGASILAFVAVLAGIVAFTLMLAGVAVVAIARIRLALRRVCATGKSDSMNRSAVQPSNL